MKSNILFTTILRIVLITAIISFAVYTNAQSVALNTNGASADASAMLDVSSTSKGFLPPRMTTIQRTGISSPANGLMVFDTDTKTYWYFSTTWKEINLSGGGGFTLPYASSSANPAKLFEITNTDATWGATSIYGRSGSTPGNYSPNFTVGVWGENTQGGAGVVGYSSYGYGVIGRSDGNAAGVWGTSTDPLGVGVKGEITVGYSAVVGDHWGIEGNGGKFEVLNSSNPSSGLYAITQGTGNAFEARINNPTNSGSAGYFSTTGVGKALYASINNTNSSGTAVSVFTNGLGNAMDIQSINSPLNSYLLSGWTSGLGGGAQIILGNTNSSSSALFGLTQGTGHGISANSWKGITGYFVNDHTTNSSPTIYGYTNGSGPALEVNSSYANVINSIASFKKGGNNVARIDGNGKGFFNGGTQNSGADLAEAFDVTGTIQQYETGDVLVISIDKDRTVEKSSGAYSTLVAGVYATKPGVLLTEENIESDISDKVPMGVVGVIPTKVCMEGGEIKRGDLLVTSSIPGVAMKADIEKVKPGQAIGKALENFNSPSTGKIKVLVSVK
ncbi:MAG TPA: hypothetical protein VHQ93_08945 [Chitinophagaceae bacterium]|jgi:hypothetical protein|nr:hypothetical protein [Chitinophagaceae bacterium]